MSVPAAIVAMTAFETMMSARNQAKTESQQAALAQAQADRERAAAAQQSEDYRRRQNTALATSRARLGASGVALAGSPLLAEDAAQHDIAVGERRIRAGGEDRARLLDANAAFARGRAGSTMALGLLRSGTTLLRGLNDPRTWRD